MRAGDWFCKLAKGVSRRANSANPAGPGARLTGAAIKACEAVYRAANQPTYLRLPSMLDPHADRVLARRGYGLEGATLTLAATLEAAHNPGAAALMPRPTPEWLAAMNALNGREPGPSAVFDAVLARIAVPAAFAVVRREGRIVCAAYAALHGGWACLEAVVTAPDWRGRGLAGEAVVALLAWGATRGGEGCALQVSADNAAGRALYRRLGFSHEIYRYHYRREPG